MAARASSYSRGSEALLRLRTPNAGLGKNGGSQDPVKRLAGGHQPSVQDQVEHQMPGARRLPTPAAGDYKGSGATQGRKRKGGRDRGPGDMDLSEAVATLIPGARPAVQPGPYGPGMLDLPDAADLWADEPYGRYTPAVRRQERATGTVAPPALEPLGRGGRWRMAAGFVEWMMGLVAGRVTAVPGLSWAQQLHALGNGIVPDQAIAAYEDMAACMWAEIGMPDTWDELDRAA